MSRKLRDHVLEPPEEVIGVLEPFRRIAVAAKEIGLPRAVGGDAGHLVDLGLIGHRVGGVGRRGGDDDVDLVAKDQVGGHFGGAVRVRLAVLRDDLDVPGLAVVLTPAGERLARMPSRT